MICISKYPREIVRKLPEPDTNNLPKTLPEASPGNPEIYILQGHVFVVVVCFCLFACVFPCFFELP